jgi:APA family basic amino acid/polyamine antiporter
VLGPLDAGCIVVGAIIGVGIFFTPTGVAGTAGSAGVALLAWAVGGAIAMMGALTFAELGGLYPRTGGQYQVLRDAYGPMPAFLFVFCNATAIQAGAAAIIAIVCTEHLASALGRELAPWMVTAVSALLIVGLTLANAVGVRWGSGIQNLTVFAKVATLLIVTAIALTVDAAPAAAVADDAADEDRAFVVVIFAALVPAFFAYGGWQHALWIAGEIRDPHRNVPRAIVGGVALVVVAYLLVNWAYLHLLGHAGVAGSHALAADAVGRVWPDAGGRLVAGAVAISAFGVLNAQLLSGPRLLHGMAADGRFFRPFARVSPRFHTPAPAVILLGVMAIVLLVAAGRNAVDQLLTGVVFIDGIFFALTGLALFVLRRRMPDAERPVRVPGYPVVPFLFVLGEIGIVLGAYADPDLRQAALIGLAWVVVAAVLYLARFRSPASGASSP